MTAELRARTGCRGKSLPCAALTAVLLAFTSPPTLAEGTWSERLEPTWELLFEPDPRVLYSVSTSANVIALTIDDSPDRRTTPAILRLLAKHDVNATFFITADRIRGNEDLIRAIVRGGHELGNHMMHDRPSIDLGPGEFERALLSADGLLRRFAHPVRFRPASGWYNREMLDIVEQLGYRAALGDIYPADAAIPCEICTSGFVLWRATPGSIIILHDGGERGQRTADVLEEVLPELARRGTRVVSLSRLIEHRRTYH